MNIGIVGVGKLANVCAQALALQSEFKLVAACNHTRMRLQEFCQSYNLNGYLDLEEMVKNEQVQVLLICSPVATHYAYIKLGLILNCDIICQAPFTLDLVKLEELHNLSMSSTSLITQIDYHYYKPYFTALKGALIHIGEDVTDVNCSLYAQDSEFAYLMLSTLCRVLECDELKITNDVYYLSFLGKRIKLNLHKSTDISYFSINEQKYYFKDDLQEFDDIHNPSKANFEIFNQKQTTDIIKGYSSLLANKTKANSNSEFNLSLKLLAFIKATNIFE